MFVTVSDIKVLCDDKYRRMLIAVQFNDEFSGSVFLLGAEGNHYGETYHTTQSSRTNLNLEHKLKNTNIR